MDRADLRFDTTCLILSVTYFAKVLLTELSLIFLDDMSGCILTAIVVLGMNAAHLIIQFILDLLSCSSTLFLIFETVWAGLPLDTRIALLLLSHAHIVLRCW